MERVSGIGDGNLTADESCNWTQDSDANWDTQCGNIFTFTDGESPADHNIAFCGYCGKKIAQRSCQPEFDDE